MNLIEENRLEKIESRIAYLEKFLQDLQSVTLELSNEIRILQTQKNELSARVFELLNAQEILNTRPPHF